MADLKRIAKGRLGRKVRKAFTSTIDEKGGTKMKRRRNSSHLMIKGSEGEKTWS